MTATAELPRMQYAGRWWRATNAETVREIRAAIGDGQLARVFAKAMLDGRVREDGEK